MENLESLCKVNTLVIIFLLLRLLIAIECQLRIKRKN